MIAVRVTESSQVAAARREACRAGAALGFPEPELGRVAIIATELATNLVRHGSGGELLVADHDDALGKRLDLTALDQGSGMADLSACLRDGFSTAGSPGTGLGAVMRQATAFDVFTRIGGGTAILARVQPRVASGAGTAARVAVAGVCLAKAGETECGDAWAFMPQGSACTVMLADGLGHGPLAAAASGLAAATFTRAANRDPADITRTLHDALRVTRGAAVSVVRLDFAGGTATFCGIGNVAGSLLNGTTIRRMVTLNGTAGAAARRIQAFGYPLERGTVAILFSDGLVSSWTLDPYPGLLSHDPALIAGVLYRDFVRGRDDVTVVVAKETP